jgi:D-glycero-D-manno-heptose 1,7-bisphosphate phosphatase
MSEGELAPEFAACLVEPGLWVEASGRTDWPAGRPALFLDRDGTINVDTDYPSDPDEIVLKEAVVEIIQAGNEADIPVVVVSNQSGIARGYFGWGEFAAVNGRVLDLLAVRGCSVDLVIACAYHESGQGVLAIPDHPMRKPNPGMLFLARDRLGVALSRSIMVGDKPSDMEAAWRAGLARGWLIGDGTVDLHGFSLKRLNTDADHRALVKDLAIRGDGGRQARKPAPG